MKSLMLAAAVLLMATHAEAQQIVYYSGYAPAPVIAAPVYAAPAPFFARRVVYRPVVPVAAPVVTSHVVASPVVAAPVVTTTALQPVVTTRYRPILGGTVSRVRYRYAPVTYIAPGF
jgi:hypothetical protein